jgi:hypothetical protein
MITDLKSLQEWIEDNHDPEIERRLSDKTLLDKCVEHNGFKKKAKKLEAILKKNNNTNRQIENIIKDYIDELVPAGTKGVVRGNKFNNIVKETLLRSFEEDRYELAFEKNCEFPFSEIPDWYIKDKVTKQIIVGYNQIDLWRGGAQLNRASKYIMDDNFHLKYEDENVKVLSVVCNKLTVKSETNKPFKIMKYGVNMGRVCYIKNLVRTIDLML